jgi:uncharacterized RDD family membrane protein YckC
MKSIQINFIKLIALLSFGLLGSLVISMNAVAQDGAASASVSATADPSAAQSQSSVADDQQAADDSEDDSRHKRWQDHSRSGNELVTMGGDSYLAAGKQADTVVSILGSSSSDGEVKNEIVSIMGDTRVTGPVGGDAVAVMGSVYVNSKIEGEVVAVFGNVELGSEADVAGDVVAVGGTIKRDPAAVVRGDVNNVAVGLKVPNFAWLQPWIDQCLKYARPLALGPGLAWAWIVALISLLTYVMTAWLAPRPVQRCVETFEQYPGVSLLTALAGVVLSPILMILLVITLIGILAIPFVGIALFCIGLFGKLVMLAWLGRRVTNRMTRSASDPVRGHMAIATLIGGLLVTALYLVPVLGFIVYKLLGFIGYGVVLYTLLLAFKQRSRPAQVASQNGSSGPEQASAQSTAQSHSAFTAATASAESTHTQAAPAHDFTGDSADPATSGSTASASTSPAAEPVTSSLALPRATFWVRIGALLLDGILILFVLNLVGIDDVTLLALALYGALMWKFKGTTIGGLVFHLQVLRVDGRALDWPTVVVRALSCFLSLLPAGLGFIWIAIDDDRQSWHDKIAGTVVVRMPKGRSLV